jgi:hypothetical protein
MEWVVHLSIPLRSVTPCAASVGIGECRRLGYTYCGDQTEEFSMPRRHDHNGILGIPAGPFDAEWKAANTFSAKKKTCEKATSIG